MIFRKEIIKGCEATGTAKNAYMTRWEAVFSWGAIFLHKFHRSDDNTSLHDHPWNFYTFVLWRGYNDCTYNERARVDGGPQFKKQRLRPGMLVYRKAEHIHYVELIDEKPAWTLVVRFKYTRFWGFWRKGVFTVFSDYFKQNGC